MAPLLFATLVAVSSLATPQPGVAIDSGATHASMPRAFAADPDIATDCAPGTYPCGDGWCTPDGAVCCASVGYPQYYCDAGSICCADGSGCSYDGSCGGGGACEYGEVECSNGCCSAGTVCPPAGSNTCCPSETPYYCFADGWCHADAGSCGASDDDGGTDDGGPTGPGDVPSGYYCATADIPGASCDYLRYCLSETDSCSGYYEADGLQFPCGNACDAESLQSCAYEVADYCTGDGDGGGAYDDDDTYDDDSWDDTDDSSSRSSACAVDPDRGGAASFLLVLLVGLRQLRRRRADP